MNFNGKISNISVDYLTGNIKVEFEANKKENILEILSELRNCDKLTVEVKKFRKKRSLDANALLWKLCSKLAEKLSTTKEQIYKKAISEVGQFEILPIRNDAVQTFVEVWEGKGLGFVCETIGASKLKGYTNIIAYYGSSTYDSKSMSILVDYVAQECRELGIDIQSQKEIENILKAWGKA